MRQLNEISEDVVVSSQWQTRFARAYIASKDPRRFKWYNIISGILDGKIERPNNYGHEYWDLATGSLVTPPEDKSDASQSVEDRFLKHNITPAELNKLKEARNHLGRVIN